jgi:hypothetical protein
MVPFQGHPKVLLYNPSLVDPWHDPLNKPDWRTGKDAHFMHDDDTILGLKLDQAWALPWWVMKNHHAANLELDGERIYVAFCEACSSGAAYKPFVDGKLHTFHPVGHYNGSNLMSDFETGSLWAPFNGECIYGSLKGKTLTRIPLFQSSWKDWLTLHPDSFVAFEPPRAREGHSRGAQPGGPGIGSTFTKTLLRPLDNRLPINKLVLGVSLHGKSRAYPLDVLDRKGAVLNDTIANEQIVIFHKPNSILASAFFSKSGETALTFFSANEKILDRETGSVWSVIGEAEEGPLKGTKLTYVFSGIDEWYIWAAYHPDTDIFLPASSSLTNRK